MSAQTEVAQLVARAPMRTIRVAALAPVYAHPRPEARALERRGVLHRLAHGYYCAVPPEHDPSVWRPTIEAAAAGIATAIHGDRVPVLVGLTAARVLGALPRASGVATVAVPAPHRPVRLTDRDGEIRFAARSVADLDAVLMATDLGRALTTTPEQTVLDLARADPRWEDPDVGESVDALWPQCDQLVLADLAQQQGRGAALERLKARQ